MIAKIITSPCPTGAIQQWQNKLMLCMTSILLGPDMLQRQQQSPKPHKKPK